MFLRRQTFENDARLKGCGAAFFYSGVSGEGCLKEVLRPLTCSKSLASLSDAYRMTELGPEAVVTALGVPSGSVGQSEGSARNTCNKAVS
jgi:hypothetical protein